MTAVDNPIILFLLTICCSSVYSSDTPKCINVTALHNRISDLYWDEHNYQDANDPVSFNLCKGSDTAVEIKFPNNTVIGNKYIANSTTDHNEVMLEFDGENDVKIFVYFTCEKNTLGKPVLLDTIGKTFYFEWRSLIACQSYSEDHEHQIPCYVYDTDHNLHDLSGLTKIKSPLSVTTADSKSLEFNVCRKVSGGKGSCDAGACLYSSETAIEKSYPITQTTDLTYNTTDKSINVDYVNGYCKVSLKFLCPTTPSESRSPVVIKQGNCSYVVEWYTTHACTAGDLKVENTCKLVNSQYGITIDLTPLSGKVYDVTTLSYTFKIGMCDTVVPDCPLKNADSTRGETVACQISSADSSTHSLGMSQFRQLGYIDDILTMKLYKGDTCDNRFQRETIINFHCNETGGVGVPEYVSETECSYQFVWHTKYACNQDMTRQCKYTTTDGNKTYDFTSLSMSPASVSWKTEYDDEATAYINVCQPVGSDRGCDPTSSVCVKQNGASQTNQADAFNGSSNLGTTTSMKFGEDSGGLISLTYESGNVCKDAANHKSIIYFSCPSQDSSEGPHMQKESGSKCVHKFMWFTSAACAEPDTPSTPTASCTITAGDGYVYDLASAQNLNLSGLSFDICAPLASSGCGSGAYVCDGDKALSKKAPSIQQHGDDLITATFTPEAGGEQVIVQYNCKHTAEQAKITGVTRLLSSIQINVDTTLSCAPKDIDCKPIDSNGNTYDLSGLKGEVYEAVDNLNMSYFFSVCGVLDRQNDNVKDCEGGAISACQRTTDKTKLINIGYAHNNPEVVTEGTIHLHYLNGKKCGHGNKTPRSTTIILNCAEAEAKPVLHNEDGNCNYEIWFDTPAACPIKDSKTVGCSVLQNGVKYDLSSLNKTEHATDNDENEYYISICSKATVPTSPSTCGASSVCMKSSGTYTSVDRYYKRGETKEMTISGPKGQVSMLFSYRIAKYHNVK